MKVKLVDNLNEGVRKSEDRFIINMTSDESDDIIRTFSSEDIYISEIDDSVYAFGYKFEDSADKQVRSQFIKELKFSEITPAVESFIIRPVRMVQKKFNTNFDLFVYPRSERSNLVDTIVKCMTNILQHNTNRASVEAVKNLPSEIRFDYESLKDDLNITEEDSRFKDIYNYVENILMPKIHNLSYFSLADNVKPKYRRYIQDYLIFSSTAVKLIESINAGNVLIIDDINTSGATIREIVRLIKNINLQCNIFVFTLIGK